MTIDIRDVAEVLTELYVQWALMDHDNPPSSAAVEEILRKRFPNITSANIEDAACLITVCGFVER
jgi:hypothetical protein